MGKKKLRNTAMFLSFITPEGVLSVKQSSIAGLSTYDFRTVILGACPAFCKACMETPHAPNKCVFR